MGAFLLALNACSDLRGLPPGSALVDNIYPWITAGQLHVDFALRVDALSAVMILIVTGVGSLIHVYSVGYMAHDEDCRPLLHLSQSFHRLDAPVSVG